MDSSSPLLKVQTFNPQFILQRFTEDEFTQSITVPIINDNQYAPDTDFYVVLKNITGDAVLGDPSVTRVTIIDDDSK